MCRNLAEWAAVRSDAELIGYIPEEVVATRALPSNASSVPRFASECQVHTFDRTVVRLKSVRLYGGEGMLELPDGKFLLQTVWYPRQLVTHPDYYRREERAATPLGGEWHPLIVYWSRSYYHWLVETLPLFHGLELFLPSGIKHVVPGPMSRFHSESLELLGVEPSQYREIGPDEVFELESAYVAPPATVSYAELPVSMLSPHWLDVLFDQPFTGPFNHSPTGLRWVAAQMVASSKMSAASPPSPRRIYISRRLASCRRLNDDDLEPVLSKHQITVLTVENYSLAEQVRLFHHAELVVAPHGAGLSNLMFCKAGTRVLEIFEPSVVRLCYWSISDTFNLKYDFLLGGTVPSAGMDPDIHLDPSMLDEALTATLHEPIPQGGSSFS